MNNTFKFKNKIWLYSAGNTAWHFVSVPEKESIIIKQDFKDFKKGWGSFQVLASIGKTNWQTSIFPDKKRNEYLLPIKLSVRQKEDLNPGDLIDVKIEIKTN